MEKEEKMRKKFWMSVALFLVIPGLLFTVSCAKKAVTSGSSMSSETSDDAAAKAKQAELDRQRAIEEAKIAEAKRKAEMAKQQFLNEDVYFEFDSSALMSDAQDVLRRKAAWLRENADVSVIVEGHCDERGTNEYNMALGDRRAESAKQYLMDLGISAQRLQTISYGEERPVDPGHNEAAWAKNRRAHFVVR